MQLRNEHLPLTSVSTHYESVGPLEQAAHESPLARDKTVHRQQPIQVTRHEQKARNDSAQMAGEADSRHDHLALIPTRRADRHENQVDDSVPLSWHRKQSKHSSS